jgi:hypothetical protein
MIGFIIAGTVHSPDTHLPADNLTTDSKFTIHIVYLLLTFLLFILLNSEQSMLTATDLQKIAAIIKFCNNLENKTNPVTIGLNSEINDLLFERFLSEEIWESIH